jgi:GNAT superfamily N-acetyltransferase
MSKTIFRTAEREDVSLILTFIKALAAYEHLENEVTATEETLMASLFDRREAEVIICEYDSEPVGFALYFYNYSTFLGKSGLYLEDLFILKAYRGLNIGKQLLAHIAKIAVERGCGRFEWSCLDWNKSSIAFYEHMGAKAMDDWTVYRLTGDALISLASEKL